MKERLKELRKILNLTQRELAEKIGVKTSQVGGRETGYRALSAARIAQICAALHVRREWFETGQGDVLEPQRPEKRLLYWRKMKSLERSYLSPEKADVM